MQKRAYTGKSSASSARLREGKRVSSSRIRYILVYTRVYRDVALSFENEEGYTDTRYSLNHFGVRCDCIHLCYTQRSSAEKFELVNSRVEATFVKPIIDIAR